MGVPMSNHHGPLLQVKDLRTHFHTDDGVVLAVDGCSFDVERGERIAIVGESGSGKSVTALSIMRLVPSPGGRIMQGSQILFKGNDLLKMPAHELEHVRGSEIGMVFQDPLSAMNPVLTVGYQIREAMHLHRDMGQRQAQSRAVELLAQMGIPRPETAINSYPHQLSGGMRQRAMIAMAISCQPDLLIADEPTTALDVTIQAQIMELLLALSNERHIAVILITHDLGIAAAFANRIIVMYAGKMVETGTTDQIFYQPQHPYTIALLKSIARLDQEVQGRLYSIKGVPPNVRPSGCPFHPRCEHATQRCTDEEPLLKLTASGHPAACHYAGTLNLDSPTRSTIASEEPIQ